MRVDQLQPCQKFKAEWLEDRHGVEEATFIALDSDGDAWYVYAEDDRFETSFRRGDAEVTLVEVPKVKVPEGWYVLRDNDTVQEGDQYADNSDRLYITGCAGRSVKDNKSRFLVVKCYIRKVAEVPEGYVALNDGDTLQKGDMYLDNDGERIVVHSAVGKKVKDTLLDLRKTFSPDHPDYCRAIIRPVPVVKVPDGYKALGSDLVTQKGDKYLLRDGGVEVVHSNVGKKVCDALTDIRGGTGLLQPTYATTIIRPKAKDYAALQAEWVTKHDIKVGSKVKLVRKPTDGDPKGHETWVTPMDKNVGRVLTVTRIGPKAVAATGGFGSWWNYPFFCLEPIADSCKVPEGYVELGPNEIVRKDDALVTQAGHSTEPRFSGWSGIHPIDRKVSEVLTAYPHIVYVCRREPKIVPYGFEDNLIGTKIKSKDGTVRAIITYQSRGSVCTGGATMTYEYLLERYETITGKPLGKLQ